MTTIQDIDDSRKYEMETYLASMEAMYENALEQNGEIYDIALDLTNEFTEVSEEAILEDSRIIKVLRYAIAPSISQMKFGQCFGLNSIDKIEKNRIVIEKSKKGKTLKKSAKRIWLEKNACSVADFVDDKLDRSRFIWLDDPALKSALALEYAKKWTCSIAADQNAQTNYRNWRKDQQEHKIIAELISMGYVKSGYSGTVTRDTDINIGEFTFEMKVKGRTVQKADVVFRSKKTKKLVLVEAKAVGVQIDATKRIKECCDKANDWGAGQHLNNPEIVAVIAGFFTTGNLDNLAASGVHIVWEHRLSDLASKA